MSNAGGDESRPQILEGQGIHSTSIKAHDEHILFDTGASKQSLNTKNLTEEQKTYGTYCLANLNKILDPNTPWTRPACGNFVRGAKASSNKRRRL